MKTPDLFPAELAAAQDDGGADTRKDSVRQARDTPCDASSPFEPLATDGLGLTEDDKHEEDERYWFWDDNDYAEQVCIKRHGPL